jgi:hypothetical protein
LNRLPPRRVTAGWLGALTLLVSSIAPGLPSRGPDLQAALHLDPLAIPRPAWFAFAGARLGREIGSGFVLPGDTVRIEVIDGGVPSTYALLAGSGAVRTRGPRAWEWIAPAAPGIHRLVAVDSLGIDTMRIHAFVMVPYTALDARGMLNGHRIGAYPGTRTMGGIVYERPRGFIEVTDANRETRVSTHFTLGQFAGEKGAASRYIVLSDRLVAKLEAIVDGLHEIGHACTTLGIMSGYRTPAENRAMGNAAYSRHLYGDAADFFVDAAPVDGRMDDLNNDGKVDAADARTLQCVIENLAVDTRTDIMPGGLGTYRSSVMHGPFVHTDARGFRARWGITAECGGG